MAKKRKKKYEKLYSLLEGNIIDKHTWYMLIDDPELVKTSYTLTTSGGKGIFWKVNTKDPYYTISTGSIDQKMLSNGLKINIYRHYVLTSAGVDYLQGELVGELL